MHGVFSDEHFDGASSLGTVFRVRLDSKGMLRVEYCQARIVAMLFLAFPGTVFSALL